MVQVVLRRATELSVRRVLGAQRLRKALRGEGADGALELLIQLVQGVLALAPGLRTKLRHWRPLFLRRELRTFSTNTPKNQDITAGQVKDGERHFIMTGQWLKVRQEAEKELLALGFNSMMSGIDVPNTYAKKTPPARYSSTPGASTGLPIPVLPDVWVIPRPHTPSDMAGEKPIRIEITVSEDVATRTTWDRLLALLKG